MKYEITRQGSRIEGYGAHSGYRIRLSTTEPLSGQLWPLHVGVRGSESEDELSVPLPDIQLRSLQEAFDFGFECATLYIDAEDRRLP